MVWIVPTLNKIKNLLEGKDFGGDLFKVYEKIYLDGWQDGYSKGLSDANLIKEGNEWTKLDSQLKTE